MAHLPHIVIAGVEPWGHARPLCAFASKAVLTQDVYITLFTHPRVCEKVKQEVSRGFNGPQEAERKKFIRVVALDCLAEGADFADTMRLEQVRYLDSFLALYAKLLEEKPVTCFTTKTEFPAISAPKMVVLDFIVGPLASMLKTVPGNKAKIIGFNSGMASFIFFSFAPAKLGGRGDFKTKALQEAERTGKHVNEVANEMIHVYTDEVTQIPGFPKMHHWEYDPQDTTALTLGFMGVLWMSLLDAFDAIDGVIITSPEVYEPKAITATREWFAETNRGVWAIGPLLPKMDTKEAREGEAAQSEKSAEVQRFMEMVIEKFGERKMLYISFGSAFWPPQPEKLEAFVDVLLEKKIPFIFSHGSPIAQLSDAFKTRVEQSGIGLLSKWSAQQTILVHPALGWFVSHCGHNSALEATASGVPIIAWPFHADQSANAVNLTVNHDVAFELLEVRTGNGLKPIYRTGKAPVGTIDAIRAEASDVLDRAFGEEGARKRANAKSLQAKILSAWNKGGSAEVDMAKLLKTLA
ncbi:hypothetical protein EIP91_000094 [Steccherinum ochraceum]|uniref:UDP-glycosyltransferases domain-containing protein n=1 Tax=Steccherinum ochraceum TaxID=92696 RepID=A0A4R0RX73_9APHY|nr:hypothetical protein EIP91_000094 [Steccherinum ochraceum]